MTKFLKLIRTTTTTGLKVTSHLDTATYPTSLKLSKQALAVLAIQPKRVLPEWNYTLASKDLKIFLGIPSGRVGRWSGQGKFGCPARGESGAHSREASLALTQTLPAFQASVWLRNNSGRF